MGAKDGWLRKVVDGGYEYAVSRMESMDRTFIVSV